MSKEAAKLTAAQAFQLECLAEVSYLALSDGQQWVSDDPEEDYYEVEVAHVLRYMVHRTCFTSSRGTFRMVNPATDACRNVSVYLWLIEMARRTGISPVLETLVNSTTVAQETQQIEWYNVILPIPPHLASDFNDTCQAHLTGVQQKPPEGEAPPARRAGRPAKAKVEKPDAPDIVKDHRASWKWVQSAKDILAACHRASMCEDSDLVHRVNFDVDSVTIDAMDVPDGINTICSLFDLEKMLNKPAVQAQLEETNAPDYARTADSYVRINAEGKKVFGVHRDVYDTAPWVLRRIHTADRCINPSADALFPYLLPNNDPSLALLRNRFTKMSSFNGVKRKYARLSDDETRDLFVGPTAKHRRYSHTVEVKAPNPLGVAHGITFSDQWNQKLYPVHAFIKKDNIATRVAAIQAVANGRLPSTAVFKAHEVVADVVQTELETMTLGTVGYYREVYADLLRLQEEIWEDNEVAEMARAMLYYDESAADSEEVRAMPSFDRGLLSLSDSISNHHLVTPQQLAVILKLLVIMFGSARNEFKPVVAVALFGKSDVGKSYCIKKVTSLLPESMQEAENDSSEKAWVLDTNSPFKFCWMDEVGVGLADNGQNNSSGKSKDSKNMQASMSNAVMSYKQYNRGAAEGGMGDHLKLIQVDCRKTYAITSNRTLNEAMMSRVEPIPTYDDSPRTGSKGLSKLQKATCNSDSLQAKATSLMCQYIMAGSMFVWAFHAAGGFVYDIDESLFEVFVAMQTKVMGGEQTKCRPIDRLKQHSVSLMNFAFVNELMRKRENLPILNDMHRLTAFIIARCSVVPLRMVECAFSMTKASAEFEESTARLLIAVKKHLFFRDQDTEPSTDADQLYYETTVDRKGGDLKLYQACEAMGHSINYDVLTTAKATLECSSDGGLFKLKYGAHDKLMVLKSVINDSRILTDTEDAIMRWLIDIYKNHYRGAGTIVHWRYDYDEKHVIFAKHIYQQIDRQEVNKEASAQDRARGLPLLSYDDTVRTTAFHHLMRAQIKSAAGENSAADETVFSQSGAHTTNYNGAMIYEPDDVMGHGTEDTRPDGPVPGKKKKPICMAGGLRVPLTFIETYADVSQQAAALIKRSSDFSNVLHACSGEVKQGQRIFRAFSKETDHETCAGVTTTVGPPKQTSVTYANPRAMNASNVYDPSKFFKYEDLHREDERFVTARAGDNIYRKRVEKRVKMNTGVTLAEWESHYNLPPLFGSDDGAAEAPPRTRTRTPSHSPTPSVTESAAEAMEALAALNGGQEL